MLKANLLVFTVYVRFHPCFLTNSFSGQRKKAYRQAGAQTYEPPLIMKLYVGPTGHEYTFTGTRERNLSDRILHFGKFPPSFSHTTNTEPSRELLFHKADYRFRKL